MSHFSDNETPIKTPKSNPGLCVYFFIFDFIVVQFYIIEFKLRCANSWAVGLFVVF